MCLIIDIESSRVDINIFSVFQWVKIKVDPNFPSCGKYREIAKNPEISNKYWVTVKAIITYLNHKIAHSSYVLCRKMIFDEIRHLVFLVFHRANNNAFEEPL